MDKRMEENMVKKVPSSESLTHIEFGSKLTHFLSINMGQFSPEHKIRVDTFG